MCLCVNPCLYKPLHEKLDQICMALSYSQYSLVSYSAPKTLSLEPHLVAHPISPDASTPISPGPQITPAPPQAPGTPLRPPTSNRPQMIRKPNYLLDKDM